jgi:RHS repeat-associated protein
MTVRAILRFLAVLCLTLVLTSPTHAADGVVSPGQGAGGNVCKSNGAGNTESSCSGAGNPINLITGNKYQREVDLPPLPGVMGLEIVRHYNSTFAQPGGGNGLMGRGWRLSYEVGLYVIGNTVQIIEADGHRIIFSRDPLDPSRCGATDPANGSIAIRDTARGEAFLWTRGDGQIWDFDEYKKLRQIRAPTGEAVSLQYDRDGLLVHVTDPQGRRLLLSYLDRHTAAKHTHFSGVQSITSPVGRFTYDYGSPLPKGATLDRSMVIANLVKVSPPNSTHSRQYHYEDTQHPTLMTGISVTDAGKTERISTFGYQDDGRAILSTHANNVDRVTLRYPERGATILTNSLGQTTIYRHTDIGGEYRLLEARGPGCRLCDAANVRYGYDKLGRQTEVTRLAADGTPLQSTRTTRDYVGRPLTVGTINYSNGQPGPLLIQRRYEYGPGHIGLPVLIARPSVIDGKEAITRISYNAANQPLTVTETGWAPAMEGTAPTAIERTTNYRYTEINRHSVLTQIDGPLPNGPRNSPADSDITAFKYDPDGNFVTETVAPGNRITRTRRDDATGFPVAVEAADGVHPSQRIRITSNLHGQPERIVRELAATTEQINARSGWLNWRHWLQTDAEQAASRINQQVTQIRYNALGQAQRITRPDGSWSETVTDSAGRPIGLRDQDGNTTSNTLDTESRLLTALRHSADASTPLDVTTAFEYDDQHRVTRITDPASGVTQYRYDSASRVTAITDALQRQTAFDYDADGRLTRLVQNADSPAPAITQPGYVTGTNVVASLTAANGATTTNKIDDFGRTLVIDSPDSSKQIAHYDAADHLIASTDANGNRKHNTWDAAGRLLVRTVTGRDQPKPAMQVTYRYQGSRLIAVADPQQTTQFRYDANGNVIEKSEQLTAATGKPLSFVTHYHYDALNRLDATTLASGETVKITYGTASRPQRIALTSADGKLTRALATDIQIHPFTGLTGFTHGNGLTTRYDRNRSTGQLVAVTVGAPTSTASAAHAITDLLPSANAAHAASDTKSETTTGQHLRKLLYAQRLDYDTVGRITGIARTRRGHATPVNEKYEYDQLDRLSKSDTPTEQASWRYDAVGNRLSDNAQQTLTYAPASNRLAAIIAGDKTTAYTYDAAGNPTAIGQRTYQYGVTGRLQQVSDGNRLIARYAYNASGERISKTVFDASGKPTSTYFLYHGNRLDAEADGQGRITAHYLYFDHAPVAKLEYRKPAEAGVFATAKRWLGLHDTATDSSLYAIHTDHLGTPQLVTDDRQQPVWQASFSAFGKANVSMAKITLNLRLPGQYFDAETATHYNLHRDYDPQTGRYLTSDPIGLDGGFNTYNYVSGNPLGYVDLLGLAASCPASCTPKQSSADLRKLAGEARQTGDMDAAARYLRQVLEVQNWVAACVLRGTALDMSAEDAGILGGMVGNPESAGPVGVPVGQFGGRKNGGITNGGTSGRGNAVQPRKFPQGTAPNLSVNWNQQNKHIVGTNEYRTANQVTQRSPLAPGVDAQALVNQYAGTGQAANRVPLGQPGSVERISTNQTIGTYYDNGVAVGPTTNFTIRYGKDGVHIIPSRPQL